MDGGCSRRYEKISVASRASKEGKSVGAAASYGEPLPGKTRCVPNFGAKTDDDVLAQRYHFFYLKK